MISQTLPPLKWVIVSDGSTDGTDGIVTKYLTANPWIELVRIPERRERSFSGKVQAFNTGYARVAGFTYDAVASLDADISFDNEYFSFLLEKLSEDPGLGLVGTPFKEAESEPYDYRFVSIAHVSGACQLFRRQCFEEIGGYVPMRGGGIDYVAVVSARMKGWKTRTFTERVCFHHRCIGTAERGIIAAKFSYGVKDYRLGNHPIWELFRGVYQMIRRPCFIGGLAMMLGYICAAVRMEPRPVPDAFVAFVRREQMHRLRQFLLGTWLADNQAPAQSS
jgi:glycosyltransferase involved in cell wall biosynthesis